MISRFVYSSTNQCIVTTKDMGNHFEDSGSKSFSHIRPLTPGGA